MSLMKYDRYKDSGINWLETIPSHWEIKRAKDISTIFVPQRDKPTLNSKIGIPWVTIDLMKNTILSDKYFKHFVERKNLIDKKIRLVPKNSILTSCIGEFSITSINRTPVIINQQIQAFTQISANNILYLNYLIQSIFAKTYFEKVSTETTLKYINKEKFSLLPILLPPLQQQQQIAKYLDQQTKTIDKKISLLETKIEHYQALKKSLINETICRGLDKTVALKDSGIEWIGAIPEHWEVKRAKELFIEINDRSKTGLETLLSVSEYYGVAPRKNKVDGSEYLSRAKTLVDYKLCHTGDLIINIMLAWKRGLGIAPCDGIVSPAYGVYRGINIVSAFYHYLLRTDIYIAEFKRNSKGIIESRLRLYTDKFYTISLILPPLQEQQQIAKYLDEKTGIIDQIIANIQSQVERLKELRKSLINEVVTGKVRVPEIESVK